MASPIIFDSVSPRMGFPFLFPGQSQKEVFVNEALAMTDALLHCAVEGVATIPPATASNGTNWLADSSASGDWAGQAGKIACRQNNGWIFIPPVDGMRILNRATGQIMLYWANWKIASSVSAPAGGAVIDSEARAAIAQIIASLKTSGILPTS